jgi:hypothetical protein
MGEKMEIQGDTGYTIAALTGDQLITGVVQVHQVI